jgi:Xaa-Pro aminopeptidase
MLEMSYQATIRAGVPAISKAVYHRIRFVAHDPAVCIDLVGPPVRSILIIRDVEMERARKTARADRFFVPADFVPADGLSGDREIATAQAAIECLRRHGIRRVVADRSLPLLYVSLAREVGIEIDLDPDLGVFERRRKTEQEVSHLRTCQRDTESAIEDACRLVAKSTARGDGVLMHDGSPLTSERLRVQIDLHLLRLGYVNDHAIVASGPIGSDCHHPGEGVIRTSEPVIIDVFPQSKRTLYHGDCTRMVVHGEVPDIVRKMHAMVKESKIAAERATRAGATGDAVHQATVAVLKSHGVHIGFPPDAASDDLLFLPHGTGHGIGLDLKEPPLLDFRGVELLAGDCVTIEPGIYCKSIGGLRLEDMYILRDDGAENLNQLHDGLSW